MENTKAFKQLSSLFGLTDGKHKSLPFINEEENSFRLVLNFIKINTWIHYKKTKALAEGSQSHLLQQAEIIYSIAMFKIDSFLIK